VADRVGDLITANRAAQASMARALDANCTPRQLRVLMAVIHFTALFNRLEDRVSLGQLAEVARISGKDERDTEKRVAADLRRLAKIGCVTYKPGGGRHFVSTVGLPAPTETGVAADPLSSREKGVETDPKRGSKPALKGGRLRPRTQETLPRVSSNGNAASPQSGGAPATADYVPACATCRDRHFVDDDPTAKEAKPCPDCYVAKPSPTESAERFGALRKDLRR
jgi:hypothetical protein